MMTGRMIGRALARRVMRAAASVVVAVGAVAAGAAMSTIALMGTCAAQDVNAGKVVYTTPAVSGQLSCSAGACHAPNPLLNQNRILLAANNPGAIGLAINTVTQMAFLKGVLTSTQFQDLAAYIGNPGAATGTPVAQVAPASLNFSSTTVGSNAATQSFAISNTGSADLIVSSITGNNAEFPLISSCGTIAAGGSCAVSVGFTPMVAGTRNGTVTISHNASGGSSTVALSGIGMAATPAVQVTPPAIDFGAISVGQFSGVAVVTVASTGTAPLKLSTISSSNQAFAIVGGSCGTGTSVSAGSSCTIQLRFTPVAAGTASSTLSVSSNASGTASTVILSGTGLAGATGSTKLMVEYRYVPLNYFFITSRDDDKLLLDKTTGFQRTGLSFPVYAAEVAGSKAISRFYFDQIAMHGSRGSHFYTLLDSDKAALTAQNPTNQQLPRLPYNEGVDSWAFLPTISGPGGTCANGLTPVYRLFRGGVRFPDDPNHRFTTDLGVYNAFVALGWDGEGVNFCVPAQ